MFLEVLSGFVHLSWIKITCDKEKMSWKDNYCLFTMPQGLTVKVYYCLTLCTVFKLLFIFFHARSFFILQELGKYTKDVHITRIFIQFSQNYGLLNFIHFYDISNTFYMYILYRPKSSSWSLSYSSWIYNYMCNQCPSPLTLWVHILLLARFTRYNMMW